MAGDPYKYFRIEARELLDQLSQGALDLEKGPAPGELLPRMLRAAHTLKGAARVVKEQRIAEQAHRLEDLFTTLRDRTDAASRQEIDQWLALLDGIGTQLATLTADGEPAPRGPATASNAEIVHVLRPDVDDVDALTRGIAEVQSQLAVLRPRVDELTGIQHLVGLVESQLAGLDVHLGAAANDRQRVEKALSMIDEARRRIGALQRQAAYSVDRADGELRQVGDAAARLRLLPANGLLRFLERAVRDAAQAVGKRVRFHGRGGDIRLESDIVTVVQGALLQLVRNAVAHGIESTAEERRAAGKSPEGQVVVTVLRRGASLVFVCADDGGGIDVAALRRVLQQQGVRIPESQAIDDDELLRRLLKGGISTAETLSDVAGRGIGLDVVREAGERLGGHVAIRTEPKKGTTIELTVPSSLASFPALLVEAAGVVAAVPLEAVRRTVRVDPETVIETAQGRALTVDDRSVRLSALAHFVAATAQGPAVGTSAFVLESDGRTAAFVVDRVLGTADIVVRRLPAFAPTVPWIVGASLDVDGTVRVVLDAARLIAEAEHAGAIAPEPVDEPRAILIVDDSLTTRMLEQSILESAGYDVSVASSGEEGLQKAREGRFALFLVDVEMPGMDGFTFIEQVRADPALHATPAILVTSRASAEDRQRGREVGAQGYIVKGDFDQRALLEQIGSLVH
jgi:two-component system chemotaxis sensor kinase CheA